MFASPSYPSENRRLLRPLLFTLAALLLSLILTEDLLVAKSYYDYDLSTTKSQKHYITMKKMYATPDKARMLNYVTHHMLDFRSEWKKDPASWRSNPYDEYSVPTLLTYDQALVVKIRTVKSDYVKKDRSAGGILMDGLLGLIPYGSVLSSGGTMVDHVNSTSIARKIDRSTFSGNESIQKNIDDLRISKNKNDRTIGLFLQRLLEGTLDVPRSKGKINNHPLVKEALDIQGNRKLQAKKVAEISTNLKQATHTFNDHVKALKNDITSGNKALSLQGSAILASLSAEQKKQRLAKEANERAVAAERQFNYEMSEYQGALDLFSFAAKTLGGNPRLANDAQKVGGAILNIANLTHKKVGLLTLSSGYLTAFTVIASIGQASQPSDEQIIMEMIQQLREQILELRNIVVDGFTLINRNLGQNFSALFDELAMIKRQGKVTHEMLQTFHTKTSNLIRIADERSKKHHHDAHNQEVESCLKPSLGNAAYREKIDSEKFESCLISMKSFALTQGGFTRLEQSSYDPTEHLDIGDISIPYDEAYPKLIQFTNQYKADGTQILMIAEDTPLSQFINESIHFMNLVNRNTDFSVEFRNLVITTFETLAQRAKHYARTYRQFLFKSDATTPILDLATIKSVIDDYKNRAKNFAATAYNLAHFKFGNPANDRVYSPANPATQTFVAATELSAIVPTDRAIPLCSQAQKIVDDPSAAQGAAEYAGPIYIGDPAFLETVRQAAGYTSVGIGSRIRFPNFRKPRNPTFPNLKPTAEFNKLIPNELAWAVRKGYGQAAFCFSKFKATRLHNHLFVHGRAWNYSYDYAVHLNVLYRPIKKIVAGQVVDMNPLPPYRPVVTVAYANTISAFDLKVKVHSLFNYNAGFGNAIWHGAAIGNFNGGIVTCNHPQRAPWCMWHIPGIKTLFPTHAKRVRTSPSVHTFRAEFERMLTLREFPKYPSGNVSYAGYRRFDEIHAMQQHRVDDPLHYLRALTITTLESVYHKRFSQHFNGAQMAFDGIGIERLIFEKGLTLAQTEQAIDVRANSLFAAYTSISGDDLKKVSGLQNSAAYLSARLRARLNEFHSYLDTIAKRTAVVDTQSAD